MTTWGCLPSPQSFCCIAYVAAVLLLWARVLQCEAMKPVQADGVWMGCCSSASKASAPAKVANGTNGATNVAFTGQPSQPCWALHIVTLSCFNLMLATDMLCRWRWRYLCSSMWLVRIAVLLRHTQWQLQLMWCRHQCRKEERTKECTCLVLPEKLWLLSMPWLWAAHGYDGR